MTSRKLSSEMDSSSGEQCVLPPFELFEDFPDKEVKDASSADKCSAGD